MVAADYIAEDSPGYAAALVRRIRDRARSLEEMAERGHVVPELDQPTVGGQVVGRYRLIYEISEGEVHVLGLIPARAISPRSGTRRLAPA